MGLCFELGHPLVVLVWSGMCTVRPRPRCLGFNKHVHFAVYLCVTGVHELTEPPDTSTAIGSDSETVKIQTGVSCFQENYLPLS